MFARVKALFRKLLADPGRKPAPIHRMPDPTPAPPPSFRLPDELTKSFAEFLENLRGASACSVVGLSFEVKSGVPVESLRNAKFIGNAAINGRPAVFAAVGEQFWLIMTDTLQAMIIDGPSLMQMLINLGGAELMKQPAPIEGAHGV